MPYTKMFQKVIVDYNTSKIHISRDVSITCTMSGFLELYVFVFQVT
jgi:hypothetical protein